MTPEERQLLGGLFERVREAAQGQQRDAEAEAFINNAVKAQPYAPYLLAQTVLVQEDAMKGAAQRIEELEAQVRELEARAAAPAPQQAAGGFLGGIGRSIFGGNEPPRPVAPPPGGMQGGMGVGMAAAPGMSRSGVPSTSGINVPPPPGGQPPYGQAMGAQPMGQQGGPWQQPQQQGAGGSFLKGALGAAAGVAGGMLLANAVSGMFRGDQANAAGSSGLGQKSAGENVSSSTEEKTPWGSASNNPSTASGDDWGSSTSSGGDNWDNSGSASGDDWDTGSSGGDDWGGDSGGDGE